MSLPPPPPPSQPSPPSAPATREVCYRHPDRDAGRRCTRCGRPACSSCLVQATVGSHCVDCARAARPDARSRAQMWNASQPALATISLIALNVAVFVYMVLADPSALGASLTPAHVDLALFGPAVDQGDYYRLVTSGFVHYGIIHLAFNMYLLYVLGQMIEPAIGRIRFLLVYFAGLIGGSAGALLLSPNSLTAGASGAVFGLLGLVFVGYYLNGINPLTTSVGTLLMLNLVITFMWSGRISVGGHLGGAIAGSLCALAVMAAPRRQVPTWLSYAAPAAIMLAAFTIAILSVA